MTGKTQPSPWDTTLGALDAFEHAIRKYNYAEVLGDELDARMMRLQRLDEIASAKAWVRDIRDISKGIK